MKMAVIGAGNVGGTLGTRWAKAGHQVVFGSRNPDNPELVALARGAGGNASVATVANAVAFADVVVFTMPYAGLQGVVTAIGDFSDRVLIDCTNPIAADFAGLAPVTGSAAEELAQWSGSKRVVKCFNTVGYNIMAAPSIGGVAASMLYCGDDGRAKDVVASLASDLGFDPVDAGPLTQARWLESLAWLWISMALKYGHGRDMAFVLHKR